MTLQQRVDRRIRYAQSMVGSVDQFVSACARIKREELEKERRRSEATRQLFAPRLVKAVK